MVRHGMGQMKHIEGEPMSFFFLNVKWMYDNDFECSYFFLLASHADLPKDRAQRKKKNVGNTN